MSRMTGLTAGKGGKRMTRTSEGMRALVLEEQRSQMRGGKRAWLQTANRSVQTGRERSASVTTTVTHLPLSVTEKTSRKPSPVLMYCSLMAPNSSCPAVSRTEGCTDTHVNTSVAHSNGAAFSSSSTMPHNSFQPNAWLDENKTHTDLTGFPLTNHSG